jgi:protein-tyrosine phosphatase
VNGMIDTHCHLLPMCDDGPEHWSQAIALAKEAVNQGIHTAIATPHHAKGNYYNPADKIKLRTKQLNQLLLEERVPLTLLAGQEYHLEGSYSVALAENQLLGLGNERYLLVELPSRTTPKNLLPFIVDLKSKGIQPIIAHPERHSPFVAEPWRLYEWMNEGVLFQLTAPSLVGHYGTEIQQAAIAMARSGWAQLLASDCHDLDKRSYRLREAYWMIEIVAGKEIADVMKSNAERLVQGNALQHGEVAVPSRSAWKRA